MKVLSNLGLLGAALGIFLSGSVASAGVVNTTVFYDNGAGPNTGGNITVTSFDYNTGTLTDAATGIEFEAVITLTPPAGFSLRTNGGTGDREFGMRDTANAGGNNPAFDLPAESVTATLTSITITNDNGLGGAAAVNFDGFTDVIVYFSGNDGDAAAITDGSSTLFQWEGTLDPTTDPVEFADTVISVGSGLQTWGVSGASAGTTNNALIDVSGSLPTTLVLQSVLHSGGGVTAPTAPNRIRVDDFGLQFTVTPEPASFALLGLGAMMIVRRRK